MIVRNELASIERSSRFSHLGTVFISHFDVVNPAVCGSVSLLFRPTPLHV